ncbi:Hypothetical predicted protein [Prunus dulcis]|uniref:Uncharacterized protein n=1 Tax=Prunus dulcis TaxID=3755 RepID=A0A5E4FTS0_PRUDU|nr:Hypothetical predicted protein [Prunus dulcis]
MEIHSLYIWDRTQNLNKPNEGQCMLNTHAGRPTSGFGAENLQATLNGPSPSFGVKLSHNDEFQRAVSQSSVH